MGVDKFWDGRSGWASRRALMQSLSVPILNLACGLDDDKNTMLGRVLTYFMMCSILGIFPTPLLSPFPNPSHSVHARTIILMRIYILLTPFNRATATADTIFAPPSSPPQPRRLRPSSDSTPIGDESIHRPS
ncbi:hypothetical protein CVT25_010455 [Psilocybe cyanescens]|uniref:Uncharacterized protein n=1 Tax=Psilocybe cyanescens TaxID=93625 RepID=A0A409XQA4_PSICY|nr:hypothetical protein CVT25_010455 [Psilocybe cyanescens]